MAHTPDPCPLQGAQYAHQALPEEAARQIDEAVRLLHQTRLDPCITERAQAHEAALRALRELQAPDGSYSAAQVWSLLVHLIERCA